jgi:hypothetical protein
MGLFLFSPFSKGANLLFGLSNSLLVEPFVDGRLRLDLLLKLDKLTVAGY